MIYFSRLYVGVYCKKSYTALNYLIKAIIFQQHNKIFYWSETEDSIRTWDKNHLTEVSQPT